MRLLELSGSWTAACAISLSGWPAWSRNFMHLLYIRTVTCTRSKDSYKIRRYKMVLVRRHVPARSLVLIA